MREIRDRDVRPGEGLRERKKRLTRQLISDTATWMFCERGYDNVRVADVAASVGVSEKTIFNYFPTKESLVFDREEEMTAALVAALRDRAPDASPLDVAIAVMDDEWLDLGELPADALWMVNEFAEMFETTPALQSAQQAMHHRMVEASVEALAENAQMDPRDPEPQMVGHALMGLWQVRMASVVRHIGEGRSGAQLVAATTADTERAARLLNTGLWSFNLLTQEDRTKRQIAEAKRAFDEARTQATEAMRMAREAWRSAHAAQHEARREGRGRGSRGGGGPGRGGGGGRGGASRGGGGPGRGSGRGPGGA
jgi:AcrR family transcriptional regulator